MRTHPRVTGSSKLRDVDGPPIDRARASGRVSWQVATAKRGSTESGARIACAQCAEEAHARPSAGSADCTGEREPCLSPDAHAVTAVGARVARCRRRPARLCGVTSAAAGRGCRPAAPSLRGGVDPAVRRCAASRARVRQRRPIAREEQPAGRPCARRPRPRRAPAAQASRSRRSGGAERQCGGRLSSACCCCAPSARHGDLSGASARRSVQRARPHLRGRADLM
jgi:hypothetical protein